MQRRDMLKRLGLVAAAAGSASLLAACATPQAETPATDSAATATEPEKELTEREKLIVNRNKFSFKDPENPTDFEYKHTPLITLGQQNAKGHTRVDILLGQHDIIHPTDPNHWIDYISLYNNEQLIGHVEFEINQAGGFTSFYTPLKPGDQLRAESGCNLHGIWQSQLTVS